MDTSLYEEWKIKTDFAKNSMERLSGRSGCLIEVAAQHPLAYGFLPGNEFSERLDRAVELYQRQHATGQVKIYVPGSLHKGDTISLSDAGVSYLANKGVPRYDILGQKMNEKYKGSEGVYNSVDECFVSAKIFEELQYGKLFCVCSPAQLMRKAFAYIDLGYLPRMYSVPCDNMFHDYTEEYFKNIPMLLANWEAEGNRLRDERKPV